MFESDTDSPPGLIKIITDNWDLNGKGIQLVICETIHII